MQTRRVRWPGSLKFQSEQDIGSESERILVIRFSSLGDILLAAPTLRGIRARFPSAHIDLLVASEYEEAAKLLPGPSQVVSFNRQSGLRGLLRLRSDLAGRYSILVDLQNTPRSAFLRAATFPVIWVKAKRYRFRRWLLIRFKWNLYKKVPPVPLRFLRAVDDLGVNDDGRGADLFLSDADVSRTEPVLAQVVGNAKSVVALCPGARHATKRWPVKRWIDLGRRLCAEGIHVVVVGSENESGLMDSIAHEIPDSQQFCGQSLIRVAALFQRCSVVVTNDSGLMHLAVGFHRPVVALFGPTVREFGFFPFRAHAAVIEQSLNCRPCSAMGTDKCPKRHFRCMEDTVVDDVYHAVQKLLKVDNP